MAKCKDCLDYDVCKQIYVVDNKTDIEEHCDYFKDRSKFIDLPCNVGSTVYITGEKYPCEITEVVIDRYGIHFNWVSYEKSYELTEVWNDGDFTVDDIGKTVFLTPDEALEGRETNG